MPSLLDRRYRQGVALVLYLDLIAGAQVHSPDPFDRQDNAHRLTTVEDSPETFRGNS